ncbi:hypothetical protein ATM97_29040 [Nocardia sp. MH4]|nr:hypothetical protein [Nocardia sp. MH4]
MIRLIVRDEAVHGYYFGYKFQLGVGQLGVGQLGVGQLDDEQADAQELVYELYENEVEYARDLYGPIGSPAMSRSSCGTTRTRP